MSSDVSVEVRHSLKLGITICAGVGSNTVVNLEDDTKLLTLLYKYSVGGGSWREGGREGCKVIIERIINREYQRRQSRGNTQQRGDSEGETFESDIQTELRRGILVFRHKCGGNL